MKGQGIRWLRPLRRAIALFFAVIALWLLYLTCDLGDACVRLGESSAFVAAALRAELGSDTWSDTPWNRLNHWQQLALGESAFLQAGSESIALLRSESADKTDEPLTENAPSQGAEDLAETPLPEITTAPEDILDRTLVPSESEGALATQGVYLYNRTSKTVDLAAMAQAEITVELEADGPQVLIVHTHGSEAYTMDGEDIYKESDASRTTDETYNVVRIGDEMQAVFEEMGLNVVHDRTLYDYPQYSGAYTRSSEGIQAWLKEYPSIQIVLDVHRDALIGEDGTVYKAVTDVEGEKTAQVMMIVGTDDLGQEHPHWQENLALAIRIQQNLDEQWPTAARPITLRSSRFNQQLTTGSLLVEVGSHGNTLQEAIRGARLFARAAGEVLIELM